jgi:mRNA interferase RelE/StbE
LNTQFRASFERDLKGIREGTVLERIADVLEAARRASAPHEIPGIKRLAAPAEHGVYYRIRLGDYRIGCVATGDTITFVRCLHRRDIYRYFP